MGMGVCDFTRARLELGWGKEHTLGCGSWLHMKPGVGGECGQVLVQ